MNEYGRAEAGNILMETAGPYAASVGLTTLIIFSEK